jgi:phosphatidylglycerol:prolipoprotein diacylglycerol transferase
MTSLWSTIGSAIGNIWQQLPLHLSPVAVSFGFVHIYWYALLFLVGSFFAAYAALPAIIKQQQISRAAAGDMLFGIFVAALVGGKVGFLLLYWWPFVVGSTLPHQGFALPGMSFFGGLMGVALYLVWYAKKHHTELWQLTDTLVPFVPIALFFGRLGNFVHGELVGRVTALPWGMYFPGVVGLRHPSTLYAALLEGVVLFLLLRFIQARLQKNKTGPGVLTAVFFIGYGIIRFCEEYFREPDVQIGYIQSFTLNQIFSLILIFLGIFLYQKKKK